MKRFLIERPVTAAEGTQIFWVDAESEEDALEKHEAGEGGIYADVCEVQSLGEPSVCGTIEPDDFGDFPPEVSNV
jgi:hypothetical protein